MKTKSLKLNTMIIYLLHFPLPSLKVMESLRTSSLLSKLTIKATSYRFCAVASAELTIVTFFVRLSKTCQTLSKTLLVVY